MKTKIYFLSDESSRIFYIGKTSGSLSKRLGEHLRDSRDGKVGPRFDWIRSMLSRGLLPTTSLVGEVDGNGCREEIGWIKYFRDEGINLLNRSNGGEGGLSQGACHDNVMVTVWVKKDVVKELDRRATEAGTSRSRFAENILRERLGLPFAKL